MSGWQAPFHLLKNSYQTLTLKPLQQHLISNEPPPEKRWVNRGITWSRARVTTKHFSKTFFPSLSFLQHCNGFQLENEGLARRDSLESYLSDLALSDKKGRKWKLPRRRSGFFWYENPILFLSINLEAAASYREKNFF